MISRYLLCICLTLVTFLTFSANAEEKEEEEKTEAATEESKTEVAPTPPAIFYEFPFVCEADILYTWKPLPPPKVEEKKSPDAKTPPATEEKKEEKEIEPITVFYKRAGAEGREETDVRRKLAATLQNAKKAALDFCAEKHQDQASCISRGFTRIRSEYREADFNVRKALLESVVKSCEANYGICTTATHGETICYENRPPELRPKAAEASTKK